MDLGRWRVGSEIRHCNEELSQLAVIEQEQSWLLGNRAIQFAIPCPELLHQRGETVLQRLSSEIRRSAVESLRGALEPRMTGSLECQACLVCLSSDLEACDKVTKLTLLGVLDSLAVDEDGDGSAEVLHVGWWQHVSLVVELIVAVSNSLSVAKSELRPEFVARQAALKVTRAEETIDEGQDGVERHSRSREPHAQVLDVLLDVGGVDLLALVCVVGEVSHHFLSLFTQFLERDVEALQANNVDEWLEESPDVDRIVEELEAERVALQLTSKQVGCAIKVLLLGEELDDLLAVSGELEVYQVVCSDAGKLLLDL